MSWLLISQTAVFGFRHLGHLTFKNYLGGAYHATHSLCTNKNISATETAAF